MKNKGMKLLSKIVAACFALILTISMAMPVQAKIGKEETHKIKVTGKATDGGATVDVYRIIEVNYDYNAQQPTEPAYRWVAPIAAWLKTQKGFESYIDKNNEVARSFENVTDVELSNFMRKLEKAIRDGEIHLTNVEPFPPVASATMRSQKPVLIFDNLPMGEYLILTTADKSGQYANYEYVPATANIVPVYDEEKKDWFAYDADVTIKGSPAEIEKTVDDHTVEVGQKVNYTVNVPVPYYPADATAELFRIGDYLPSGITFGQTFQENHLTVKAIYENGTKQDLGTSKGWENQNLKVFDLYYNATDLGANGILPSFDESSEKEKNVATFILDFDYDALMEKFGTIKDNENTFALKAIEVTYQGTINENAILRPGDPGYPEDADPLENKAYVGQNNNPYDLDSYEPTDDKEKVYTYAVNVAKVAEDGKTPLDGAQFQLYTDKEGKNPVKFVELKKDAKDKDGNLVKSGVYRKAKEDETETTINLEVANGEANKGKLALEGLTTGTYYLKETKAPDGYEILKDVIEVKIVDEDEDGIVDNAGDKVDKSANTNIVYKTVVNRKPPIIPVTGGMGTILFSIVGIILVVGGVTLITTYLRRKRA